MNRPPEILVNTGYVTDENGVLTEMVIPSTVETLNTPTKIHFKGKTLNYVPSANNTLEEFEAPNCQSINSNVFYNFTALTSVTFDSLKAIGNTSPNLFFGCTNLLSVNFPNLETITNGGSTNGTFKNCSNLATINMPNLKTITSTDGSFSGTFAGCTAITALNFPSLESINCANMFAPFYGLTQITSINFPKLKSTTATNQNWGVFIGMIGLTTVVLGSAGNPVNNLGNTSFKNCTQSGLTITVYTQGGASLAGEPWGATNAVIEYEEA